MFVNFYDTRFKKNTWSDTRLTDKQTLFCLCSYCQKQNTEKDIHCPLHKRLWEFSRYFLLGLPVFTCMDFTEDPERPCRIGTLYEPSQEVKESSELDARYRFLQEFQSQSGKELDEDC